MRVPDLRRIAFLLAFTGGDAAAATLEVGGPGRWPDLGSALGAAGDGDTLILAPGVWSGATIARSVTLVGRDGRAATTLTGPLTVASGVTVVLRGVTLDGAGAGRALELGTATVRVEDGALTRGVAEGGGCALLGGGSLTLVRTEVSACTSTTRGGGVFVDGGTLVLTAATVRDSVAADGFGGGVSVLAGRVDAVGGRFDGNVALDPSGSGNGGYSGALDLDTSEGTVLGSRFTANEARSADATSGSGGALFAYASDLSVTGSWLDGNRSDWTGAAIGSQSSTVALVGSRLEGNSVDDPAPDPVYGGALWCTDASDCAVRSAWFEANEAGDGGAIASDAPLTVTGTMFCRNVARSDGGAVDLGNTETDASIAGSVFAGNTALGEGGGVVIAGTAIALTNDTFVANDSPTGAAIGSVADVALGTSRLVNLAVAHQTGGGAALHLSTLSVSLRYSWLFDNFASNVDIPLLADANVVTDRDPGFATGGDPCDPASWTPSVVLVDPLANVGDPAITDVDGSRSDVGAEGGPTPASELRDRDGDGWAAAVDCDDDDPTVHLGRAEVCNGRDDDCDGLVDADDDADDAVWTHVDADRDGHGALAGTFACPGPGFVADATDCDDADAAVGARTYWADADGDGRGDPLSPITACDAPFAAPAPDDCDDSDPRIGGPIPWTADGDGDGHGAGLATLSCAAPAPGWISGPADDCDDTDGTVFPGAPEQCDGVDDDCDGLFDEDVVQIPWWPDGDGDGFGDDSSDPVVACAPPGAAFAMRAGDCDDGDATANPAGIEVCGGGDEDCDGTVDGDDADPTSWPPVYGDGDGDGFGAGPSVATGCAGGPGTAPTDDDCDDTDRHVHPGASEQAGDGVDQDCDGLDDPLPAHTGDTGGPPVTDRDGDGLSDAEEEALGSDPDDPDSDGDGVLDGAEDPAGLLDPGARPAGAPTPADFGFGCGCGSAGGGASGWAPALLLVLRRRGRRA